MHAEDVALFDDGNERAAMFANGSAFRTSSGRGVRVREIKISFRRNAIEEATGFCVLQLIPTHVRKFDARWEMRDAAGKHPKPRQRWSLVARFIESLQAQANTKKVCAAADGMQQRLAQSVRIKSGNERGAMANAGKNKTLRACDSLGLIGSENLRTQTAQSALDRSDITGAVIEQRYLHKSSLVLGKTLRNRLSRETAKRSARAKALKRAST